MALGIASGRRTTPSRIERSKRIRRIGSGSSLALSLLGLSLAGAFLMLLAGSFLFPARAEAKQAKAPSPWTLRRLQQHHNRVLYRGVLSFRSKHAQGGELIVGDNTDPWGMTWTKCTNLGIDLISTLVAERRGLVAASKAKREIRAVVDVLSGLKTYRGIFPENIVIQGGIAAEVVDGRTRYSSIDSAWVTLALSLVEARYRTADRALARHAADLIARQDYRTFVGADGMLGAGFYVDVATGEKVDTIAFSYNDRNSEARPLVLALLGMGQLPASAWENTVYQWGERDGLQFASGWHYSAFVEMTGALFFDESKLAPQSLGKSHLNYLEASVRVAQRSGHRLFGYAPACDAHNAYAEFGLDRPHAVSPYAAALLTMTGDPRALANFHQVLEALPRDGSPLADGIEPVSGQVSCPVARVLDQGLMFLALNADAVRGLVQKTTWYPAAESLLRAMDRPFTVAKLGPLEELEALPIPAKLDDAENREALNTTPTPSVAPALPGVPADPSPTQSPSVVE
jgi:hypothetical protein